jgi:outer membrane protein assembly factor BamB
LSDIGGENGEVAAVADGGPGSWRCSTGEYAATPAVVTDAVVCTTGEAGSAVALGADTGGAVWRRLLDDRILAAPAVAGRAVLVVDGSGASERSARRQATAGGGRSSTAACSTRSPSAHTTTAPRRLRSAVAGGGGE